MGGAQWKIKGDGNGGFNVSKSLFWLLITIAGGIGFTTGDLGDFLDGPTKVRRVERIEVELANLTDRFEAHVKSNIDARSEALRSSEKRFDELTERMEAQAERLDAIYRLLVERAADG